MGREQVAARSALKELAGSIRVCPIPMIITDHRADDTIVDANDAFIALTGYDRSDLLGQNCRLLAGPGTEHEARSELRAAIEQERATVVELTNYRKDGSPFRNAVMIAPVRDDQGRAEFFIGSQMDTGLGGVASGLRQSKARKMIAQLSPRVRQVLELMVAGHRNKAIAGLLGINEKTVKMHRERLTRALDVGTSAEAVRVAVEADLLVSDPARPRSGR